MGIDGVSASPPSPPQPKGKPETTGQGNGGENGGGVISKLGDGFFEGKGVSDIALRLAHDVPPDPDNPLVAPEDASKAYLKLLAQYELKYPPPPPDPVAQVDTLTVGVTVEENDVFTITLDPEGDPDSVSFPAGAGATVPNVVTGLVDAWNDAFGTDITAAAGTSLGVFTLTANIAGEAFSVTVETTDAGDEPGDVPTFDSETTTENVGAPEVIIGEEPEPDPDIVPLVPLDIVV